MWIVGQLKGNSRDTGNKFTTKVAVVLLGKWLAEYSAYVRTVYRAAKPEGDEGSVVKGFRHTSEAWEASHTLARASVDTQYGELTRLGREQGASGRGGPLLCKRPYPSLAHGFYHGRRLELGERKTSKNT